MQRYPPLTEQSSTARCSSVGLLLQTVTAQQSVDSVSDDQSLQEMSSSVRGLIGMFSFFIYELMAGGIGVRKHSQQ